MSGGPRDGDPLFPTELVFVVSLSRDSDTGARGCTGKVEQLVSGRSTSFRGTRQLLRFIASRVRDGRGLPGRRS